MGWTLYTTKHKGLGTLCEVHIDAEQSLIKRTFKPGAITVSGHPTRFNENEIKEFFDNEVYWIKKLEGEWLPALHEINYEERYIVQEMPELNLLDYKSRLFEILPDIKEQVLELYKFFKIENVFKRNGSLSNMTHRNGKLIAFDFKWAMPRPQGIEKELFTYDHYLNKIDISLPAKLREFL